MTGYTTPFILRLNPLLLLVPLCHQPTITCYTVFCWLLQIVKKQDTNISLLATCFHLPIDQAAIRLSICPTGLKKICRKHGIQRWPYRKVQQLLMQQIVECHCMQCCSLVVLIIKCACLFCHETVVVMCLFTLIHCMLGHTCVAVFSSKVWWNTLENSKPLCMRKQGVLVATRQSTWQLSLLHWRSSMHLCAFTQRHRSFEALLLLSLLGTTMVLLEWLWTEHLAMCRLQYPLSTALLRSVQH